MRASGGALAAIVAAGIAGCGSGGYMTGMNQSTGGGGNTMNSTSVSAAEYAFTPSSVTIKVGSSVTWTNVGTVAHTSTADGGSWDSGQLASPTGGGGYGGASAGGSFTHTFNAAGTFTYHCANHPTQMMGTVVVTQ